MRISDWSSDVCSSDLAPGRGAGLGRRRPRPLRHRRVRAGAAAVPQSRVLTRAAADPASVGAASAASCCLGQKLAAEAAPTRTGACIYDINLISLTCPMGDTKRPVMKENPIRSLPRQEEHTSELQSLMSIS